MINVVVLHGVVVAEPVGRSLPSGSVRWSVELKSDGGTVPVSVEGDVASHWVIGTELVVVGSVRRRFFRSGGATQSRTEVAAVCCVELSRRRTLERALQQAVRELGLDEAAALRSLARS